MRMIPTLAAIAIAAGLTVATPAAADTRLSTSPSTLVTRATPGVPTASADQYRSRYRNRYRTGWRQDRFRPRYYAGGRGNRGWRRGGVICRTSWRYGSPRRVCWRR